MMLIHVINTIISCQYIALQLLGLVDSKIQMIPGHLGRLGIPVATDGTETLV